jgi:hypothetical protein
MIGQKSDLHHSSSSNNNPLPQADLMCHLYKLDSETSTGEGSSTGGWKRRYCSINIKEKTICIWRHKPSSSSSSSNTNSKPHRLDLSHTTVKVNKSLSCPKTHGIPVLSICFSASDNTSATSVRSTVSWIHFAADTQQKFERWKTLLQIAAMSQGMKRGGEEEDREESPERDQQQQPSTISTTVPSSSVAGGGTVATPSSKFTSPFPRRASELASAAMAFHAQMQTPSPNPNKYQQQQRARMDNASTAAEMNNNAPSPAPNSTSNKSQSALLSEMSEYLNDAESFARFRSASVELHRGTLPISSYFRAYFRIFGKEGGLRFWNDLLSIVPRDDIRIELKELFKQHKHLFNNEDGTTESAAAASNSSTAAAAASPAVPAPNYPTRSSSAPDAIKMAAAAAGTTNRGSTSKTGNSSAFKSTKSSPNFINDDSDIDNENGSDTSGDDESDGFDEDDDGSNEDDTYNMDGNSGRPIPGFSFQPPPLEQAQSSFFPTFASPSATKSQATNPTPNKASASTTFTSPGRLPNWPPPSASSTTSTTTPLQTHPPHSHRTHSGGGGGSSSGSAAPTPVSSPLPTTTTPSPAASTVPTESASELHDRVTSIVSAWSLRCEHHILNLLCTLHEVLPGIVAPGAFIPFEETAPTLKEVKSTYLKAMRVLHPDKTIDKPMHMVSHFEQ